MGLKAFTLAELLIALAVLGVIATFTIPKILVAQQNQKQQAVIRETISSIETVVYNSALDYKQSGIFPTTACQQNLSAIKICPSDPIPQGCWTASMAATSESNTGERAIIMANGAWITGVCDNANGSDGFVIDWNGPDPPNVFGQDTYQMSACLDPNGCTATFKFGQMGRTSDYKRAFQ